MSLPALLQHMFDTEPTEQEKALMDLFVSEYIKDYDAYSACIRVGFQPAFAREYCGRLMDKPYVLRAITAHKNAPAEKGEAVIDRDRKLIESTLREAMQKGPFQTRVAAAKTLAGVHGIDQAPDRTAEEAGRLVQLFKDIAREVPS